MEISGFDLLKIAIVAGGVLSFVIAMFKLGYFFQQVHTMEKKIDDISKSQTEVLNSLADLRITLARLESRFEYEMPLKLTEQVNNRSEAAKMVWSKRKGATLVKLKKTWP